MTHDCSWPGCGCDPEGIDSPPCRADHANEQAERVALAGTLHPYEGNDGPVAGGWITSVGYGHSGCGVYAYMEEYPEEGSFLLHELGGVQQEAYAEGRKDEREALTPLLRQACAAMSGLWEPKGGGGLSIDGASHEAVRRLQMAMAAIVNEVGPEWNSADIAAEEALAAEQADYMLRKAEDDERALDPDDEPQFGYALPGQGCGNLPDGGYECVCGHCAPAEPRNG